MEHTEQAKKENFFKNLEDDKEKKTSYLLKAVFVLIRTLQRKVYQKLKCVLNDFKYFILTSSTAPLNRSFQTLTSPPSDPTASQTSASFFRGTSRRTAKAVTLASQSDS